MRRTPLYESHLRLGARMIEFAGWQMPVFYSGVNEEHLAVRSAAGVFDVSHMGDLIIRGRGSKEFLLEMLTNSVEDVPVGKGVYSHILDDDGHIIDDAIVYRLDLEEYLMVPNAAKVEEVLAWMRSHDPGDHIVDISDQVACLAIQGPRAIDIVQRISRVPLGNIKRFHSRLIDMGGVWEDPSLIWGGRVLTARTGYTGEDGLELMLDSALAHWLWDRLLEEGRQDGLVPAGLGARDTLRLEMGFLLSGTDFDGSQSSLQTGPDWVVKYEHHFIGKQALLEQSGRADLPRLVCLELMERGIPRHGYAIDHEGVEVGAVTSGTLSPSLHRGIAMGYVPPDLAKEGTAMGIVIRDHLVPTRVVRAPFYRK
jgi:aminomethyltransferase